MQSNAINIQPGASIMLPCVGSMVAYESGTSTTGNAYLIVRGENQSEMRLKPGQSFTGTVQSGAWYVHADDNTAAITGHIIVGDGDFHDSAINATIAGAVTITNNNANALPTQLQALSTITDVAAVTIANANTLIALIADPTQRILRIRNGHATATLYIGGAALSIANAAIVLNPGDLWIETEAAGAAWYAISDTANCNVQIQGLKL